MACPSSTTTSARPRAAIPWRCTTTITVSPGRMAPPDIIGRRRMHASCTRPQPRAQGTRNWEAGNPKLGPRTSADASAGCRLAPLPFDEPKNWGFVGGSDGRLDFLKDNDTMVIRLVGTTGPRVWSVETSGYGMYAATMRISGAVGAITAFYVSCWSIQFCSRPSRCGCGCRTPSPTAAWASKLKLRPHRLASQQAERALACGPGPGQLLTPRCNALPAPAPGADRHRLDHQRARRPGRN